MLKEFANDLKQQREKAKFTLPEISAQTRINENFLRKIESGDFSFQQEIYIRAFIKEYANALDLDSSEVLKDYDLAKKGNYNPKFNVEEKEKKTDPMEPVEVEIEEQKDYKKEIIKEEKKEVPVKNENDEEHEEPEKPESKTTQKKRVRITPDKPPDPEVKLSSGKADPSKEELPPQVKKTLRKVDNGGDNIQPSVLKGIGLFFLGVLILFGLYFMAKAVFFDDDSTEGPEIVRQKFDDVVKESERKLLGKRTDEEIRDSIRKAEEEQRLLIEQNLDTMKLTINSFKSGSLIVVSDSINIDNPEKISFTGNQYGTWRATRSFLITSPNTTAFTVELNGKKIDIKEKNVKNYLISRKDLQDSVKTGEQNQ